MGTNSLPTLTAKAVAQTAPARVAATAFLLRRVFSPARPPAQYFSTVIASVQSDLATNPISNFPVNADGSIPPVLLDSVGPQGFCGQWSSDAGNPALLRARSVGSSGIAARTITVDYSIAPYHFPIFNYGIATKGALRFPQNPTLTGATQNWEADIYVQSDNNLVALQVGGNASAVIKGTMINYSPDPTVVQGNISMDFDRAAMVEIPAGFDLYRVLAYNPASYTMAY